MASEIIGRAHCHDCGFDAAHIKRSPKCTYRYCPGCGLQTHARTPEQVKNMTDKMRPVAAVAAPSPTPTPTPAAKTAPAPDAAAPPTPSEPTPTGTAPAVAQLKRRGLFA